MSNSATPSERESLIAAASEARLHAYAPYSDFAVGAAVLTADGRIFTGVNVENASYGLTICAERSAISAAAGAGVRQITAVAVRSANGASPCGACRQVLSEFAGDIPVYIVDNDDQIGETTLGHLLPDQFGSDFLDQ